MEKVVPFLWFDGNAEEAVALYTSVIPGSRVVGTTPGPGGKPMTITFQLAGRDYIALNGGPQFRFTEALSLFVGCETQDEVDTLWAKLVEGGEPSRCGWLKDRFGLSWQIVPTMLSSVLGGPDRAGAQRAMQAMLGMVKLDIAELQRAYDGR